MDLPSNPSNPPFELNPHTEQTYTSPPVDYSVYRKLEPPDPTDYIPPTGTPDIVAMSPPDIPPCEEVPLSSDPALPAQEVVEPRRMSQGPADIGNEPGDMQSSASADTPDTRLPEDTVVENVFSVSGEVGSARGEVTDSESILQGKVMEAPTAVSQGLDRTFEAVSEEELAYRQSVGILAERDDDFRNNIITASEVVGGVDRFAEILKLQKRYDHTGMTLPHSDGSATELPHYSLDELCKVLPTYIEQATRAGLTLDQSVGLVTTLLSAGRSEFSDNHLDVARIGQALSWQADRQGPMSAEDYDIMRQYVARAGRENMGGAASFALFGHLTRMGMPIAESVPFLTYDLRDFSRLLEPVLHAAYTISIAPVDAGLFRDVCKTLVGSRQNPRLLGYIENDLALFRELLLTNAIRRDVGVNGMLSTIHEQLGQGRTLDDIAQDFLERVNIANDATAHLTPEERREQHFMHHDGPLEHSPIPYQTRRSLDDGLKDLGRLAWNESRRSEPVQEGFWVFDPESSTWYSMGGSTHIGEGRATARYPPYPCHELSATPILVHCHPVELEVVTNPPHEADLPDYARPAAGHFIAATPSRQDYRSVAAMMRDAPGPLSLRSLIVHGRGVTEFTFPNDPDVIDMMAGLPTTFRDVFLQNVDWGEALDRPDTPFRWRSLLGTQAQRDRYDFRNLQHLIRQHNQMLSNGFGMRLIQDNPPAPEVSGLLARY